MTVLQGFSSHLESTGPLGCDKFTCNYTCNLHTRTTEVEAGESRLQCQLCAKKQLETQRGYLKSGLKTQANKKTKLRIRETVFCHKNELTVRRIPTSLRHSS